jgi:hypothetical protein
MLLDVLIPSTVADFTCVGESLNGSAMLKGGNGSLNLMGALGGISGTKELDVDVRFRVGTIPKTIEWIAASGYRNEREIRTLS